MLALLKKNYRIFARTAIFVTVAFLGTIPVGGMVEAIAVQWLVKSGYEALATPLTYMVVNFLKRREGVDVYDRQTRFNPLIVIGVKF